MDAAEWSVLQPSIPGIHNVLRMVLTMIKDAVGKKEVSLLGVSSGKDTAANTAFLHVGADEDKPAET
jgi:hypothetical protein